YRQDSPRGVSEFERTQGADNVGIEQFARRARSVEILTECAAYCGNATCFSPKAEIAAQRLQEIARHRLMSVRRINGNETVLEDAVDEMAEAAREVEIGRRHVPYDHGRAADIPGDIISCGAQQGKLGVQVSIELR